MTGKFYRGAWKEDDPAIVHTFSIKPDPNRLGIPVNPVLYMDGFRLKGVTRCGVDIKAGGVTRVQLEFIAIVDMEIPVVGFPNCDGLGDKVESI